MKLALKFVRKHHRHAPNLQGGIVALGAFEGEVLAGVVILGRPSRMDGPDVIVISRLCTLGQPNLCSQLYAKARRLAQAMGFVKIKTFTLEDEPGTSLFASGAKHDGDTKGGTWSRPSRLRESENTGKKKRWQL